jgi:hypothetical protein
MKKYYVNKKAQDSGDHEVHVAGCDKMPLAQNRLYLGEFCDCAGAVKKAKETYAKSDGCYYCCNPCHTS